MQAKDNENFREEFENHIKTYYGLPVDFKLLRMDGRHVIDDIQFAWNIWEKCVTTITPIVTEGGMRGNIKLPTSQKKPLPPPSRIKFEWSP